VDKCKPLPFTTYPRFMITFMMLAYVDGRPMPFAPGQVRHCNKCSNPPTHH